MPKVVVQKWEESERGWGVRPDGYTIHPNAEALGRFIIAYWDRMPDKTPDEYSRPSGRPYYAEVSEEVFAKLTLAGEGMWGDGNNYPGDGGTDGWKNCKV
jgi:hypothetical protein